MSRVGHPLQASKSAGEWLLSSGIQQADGGVARFYRSDLLCNAPVSTEITGYAASALIYLHGQTRDVRYLDAAKLAGKYLAGVWSRETQTMPFEYGPKAGAYSYFFDLGIIIRGLLSLWRVVPDPDFLSTAKLCGESMAKDFFDGQQFGPIIDLPGKTRAQYISSQWSQSPGCYQLKAALGWYELWEVGREQRYLELYRLVLTASLKTHLTFLPGVDDEQRVMDRLHSYLYFLEGLLPVVDDTECAKAMRLGIPTVSLYLEHISPRFVRADVLAQLLRIRIFAHRYGILALDQTAAEREANWLRSFQSEDHDARLHGGFWFGRRDKLLAPHANPWVTSFALQALTLWNTSESFSPDWHDLI